MIARNPWYTKRSVVWAATLCVPAMNAKGQDSAHYPEEPVPMRLEVDIPSDRYYVGENFPVAIRIVNPNSFDVFLGGFDFGPLEPHTEIGFPEGTVFPEEARHLENEEFVDISMGGTISAMGGEPVLVPARTHIEQRRLIYIGTKLDMGHWVVMPPGTYRIRFRPTMGAVTPGQPRGYPKVNWSLDVQEFFLTMPGKRDREALEFLRHQVQVLIERERDPVAGSRSPPYKLDMYRQFLARFSDTTYEPEIRWRTAKLLVEKLGNGWVPDEGVESMLDLLENCLTFCLERGGAYAEDFLEWHVEGGGSNVFEYVGMHCRHELFELLIRKLDERYPADEEASTYRRIVELIVTEKFNAGRVAAEAFKTKYPDSKYRRHIEGALRSLERRASTNRADDGLP